MDMNKILNNFEAASTGNYEPSKSETSDMKMILESFYDVAQQDATDAKPQQLDEIASVTMSGDSADEVARLAKLMNGSDAEASQTTAYQGPPDMPPEETAMITPRMMDDINTGEDEPVEEESWDNEPDETYDDHHKMTKDLSGGLNRQKKSYPPTNGGDNPMALENSLAEELSSMLKSKMSEENSKKTEAKSWTTPVMRPGHIVAGDMKKYPSMEKYANKVFSAMDRGEMLTPQKLERMLTAQGVSPEDVPKDDIKRLFHIPVDKAQSFEENSVAEQDQDGDDDEDFADVQIARMVKSGMSKKEAKKKVKDKKYNKGSYKKKKKVKEASKPDYIDIDKDGDKKEPMKKAAKDKKKKDSEVEEAGKMKGGGDDPCWKGYKMVGTKKKNGKEVPNCVPRDESVKFDSAPVFETYVKPLLNKSPKKMVEFYDTEADVIIDRLSRERRSLSEQNLDTKLHDAVIGKLRESLSVLPESKLDEIRRRRSGYRGRSSWDPNMWGFGPSRRSLGSFGDEDRGANDEYPRGSEDDYSDEWMKRRRRPSKPSRTTQKGKFNIRIQGKVVKDKQGNPFEFNSEQSAQKAANTMSQKDWNKGKKVEVIKVM
jgi:hypothetical protein